MIRLLYSLLLAATLLPALPAVGAPAPPAVSAPAPPVNSLTQRNPNPEADALGIVGICSMNFGEMLAHPKEDWVIATDTPGKKPWPDWPGRYYYSGHMYGDQTGLHLDFYGILTVRHVLSGIVPFHSEPYSWHASPLYTGRSLHDPKSPWFKTTIFVCRIHPDLQGAARYDPVFLIPDDWQSDILSGWKYAQAHPAMFLPPPNDDKSILAVQVAALNQLLSDRNPVLVSQAVQTLSADGAFDAPTFARTALRAKGLRQGLYVYLALANATQANFTSTVDVFIQVVHRATDARQVIGITLGRGAFRGDIPEYPLALKPLDDSIMAQWQQFSHVPALPRTYARSMGITDRMTPDDALSYLTDLLQGPLK